MDQQSTILVVDY